MIKIILNGAGGRMGHEVIRFVEASDDCEIVAKVDKFSAEAEYKSVAEYKGEADVIIDFSSHEATNEIVSYSLGKKIPAVICSTGHTDEEKALIEECSKSVAVFFSANMSLGVATLVDLAKRAASLFPDADIEIVEAHHNRKKDAPSGTALMLANGLLEVRPEAKFVYGREGFSPREKNEIGIHALRFGNEVGTHEVIISTDTQVLTLKHSAETRAVFAEGAVSAARFIAGKAPGLYKMGDMV